MLCLREGCAVAANGLAVLGCRAIICRCVNRRLSLGQGESAFHWHQTPAYLLSLRPRALSNAQELGVVPSDVHLCNFTWHTFINLPPKNRLDNSPTLHTCERLIKVRSRVLLHKQVDRESSLPVPLDHSGDVLLWDHLTFDSADDSLP
jgi:hypothetical protein